MGRLMEGNDAKGAFTLSAFDNLSRPTHSWASDISGEVATLRQFMVYGDNAGLINPEENNLKGQSYELYDEAGYQKYELYDFKGNTLSKYRRVISEDELLSVFDPPPTNWEAQCYRVDWTGLNMSILDDKEFQTDLEADALNRIMKITYPVDVDSNRKELIPSYNKRGTLFSITFDEVERIKEIAYNAKGQRLLIAYDNAMMTRYTYDEQTFRLKRFKTEKYQFDESGSVRTYEPQSGSTKQDFAFLYDKIGNILEQNDYTPDCGYGATPNSLNKLFEYDALYRIISGTGRESTNQSNNLQWADVSICTTPNASNAQAYGRAYTYDVIGNIQQLQQTGNNSFTRNYNYNSGVNTLENVKNGSGTTLCSFVYDACGNLIQSNAERHYEWAYDNKMRSFYVQTGTSEPSIYSQYLYDASGSRSQKLTRTSGGNFELTIYIDGIFEYCKKKSASTIYEKNYSHIMDEADRVIEIRTGDVFPDDIADDVVYTLNAHLGSVNVRLSETGVLIDREEFYPFGDTSLRTFSYKRYRYVKKEKDSESGLYYYGERYYAAWLCRFISVDPLAEKYSFLSPYQYASNNPICDVDIDGLEGRRQHSHRKYVRPKSKTSPSKSPTKPSTNASDKDKTASKANVNPSPGSPGPAVPSGASPGPSGGGTQTSPETPGQQPGNGNPQGPSIKDVPKPSGPLIGIGVAGVAILLTIALVLTPVPNSGAEAAAERRLFGPGGPADWRKAPDTTPDTTPAKDDDNPNDYVYRAMEMDAEDGKPNVLPLETPFNKISSKHLGVREKDLLSGLRVGDGMVEPGLKRGGMSVSTFNMSTGQPDLPQFAKDNLEKKVPYYVVFRIKKSDLTKSGLLAIDYDKPGHASIQPGKKMAENEYQAAIRATRANWKVWSP